VSDVDAMFNKAVQAGAKPAMPPADMFWGDRMAKLVDPFGHHWSLATHKEDVAPDEMERRGKAAVKEEGHKKTPRPGGGGPQGNPSEGGRPGPARARGGRWAAPPTPPPPPPSPRPAPPPDARRAADGDRLAEMPGRMKERDPAQHHRARATRERRHHALGSRPERLLGGGALETGGLDGSLPVIGTKRADDLPRPVPDGVAILAERVDVDLARQFRDLGGRHADAEVAPGDAEALAPLVVEDLGPPGEHGVEHDVLRAGDVPHDPRERVQVLARAHAHLLLAHAGEGALRRRALV